MQEPFSAALLKRARTRGGMSQRELARRAAIPQSAIARIERGEREPNIQTLRRLVAGAGFELSIGLRRSPVITVEMIRQMASSLTPEQSLDAAAQDLEDFRKTRQRRLRRKRGTGHITKASHAWGLWCDWDSRAADIPPIDVKTFLQALSRHRVRYVLTGALAARVRGFPLRATKFEIAAERDGVNFVALGRALNELHARVFTQLIPSGVEFGKVTSEMRSPEWKLVTDAGRLRVTFGRPGTGAYFDLANGAERYQAYGVTFAAASLDYLLSPVEITGRLRECESAATLRALVHLTRS